MPRRLFEGPHPYVLDRVLGRRGVGHEVVRDPAEEVGVSQQRFVGDSIVADGNPSASRNAPKAVPDDGFSPKFFAFRSFVSGALAPSSMRGAPACELPTPAVHSSASRRWSRSGPSRIRGAFHGRASIPPTCAPS